MAKIHDLLGASSAHRWIECPGSIGIGEDLPALPRSEIADEGTVAHYWMEKLLQIENPLTRQAVFHQIEDEEMCVHLKEFLLFDERLKNAFLDSCEKGTFKEVIEEKLKWSKNVGGTVDRAFVGRRKGEWEIAVVDFKYGSGRKVSAVKNPQLILYGLMLNNLYCGGNAKVIRCYIYQPRIGETPISRFKIEGDDIQEWGYFIDNAEQIALNDNGQTLKSGEWCRWCKAKAVCPEQVKNLEQLPDMTKQLPTISNEKLIQIYNRREEIKNFLKSVEIYLNTQAQAGVDFSHLGLKLVETKGKRSWIDEDKVVKRLKELGLDEDIIWNKKLKGITELKKHIDKTELDKLVSTPPIRKMLVPVEDERTEVVNVKLIEKIDATTK